MFELTCRSGKFVKT